MCHEEDRFGETYASVRVLDSAYYAYFKLCPSKAKEMHVRLSLRLTRPSFAALACFFRWGEGGGKGGKACLPCTHKNFVADDGGGGRILSVFRRHTPTHTHRPKHTSPLPCCRTLTHKLVTLGEGRQETICFHSPPPPPPPPVFLGLLH